MIIKNYNYNNNNNLIGYLTYLKKKYFYCLKLDFTINDWFLNLQKN